MTPKVITICFILNRSIFNLLKSYFLLSPLDCSLLFLLLLSLKCKIVKELKMLEYSYFGDYNDIISNFIQMTNISLPGIHHTAKFFVIQLFVPRDVKSGKSCLDLMVDWIGGLHWRIGLVDRMVDWIGLDCRAIIIYLDANVFFSDVARNHNYSEFLPKHIKAVSAMRWLIQRQGKHVQC